MNTVHVQLDENNYRELAAIHVDKAIDRLIAILKEADIYHFNYPMTLECSLFEYREAAPIAFSKHHIWNVILRRDYHPESWRVVCKVLNDDNEETEYSVGSMNQ